MPYIAQNQRAQLNPPITLLIKALISGYRVPADQAGALNYAITNLILGTLFRYGASYPRIALATGILENVKLELYRRLAAPYEDEKAEENGDVYAN